jgi:hypothetical protein
MVNNDVNFLRKSKTKFYSELFQMIEIKKMRLSNFLLLPTEPFLEVTERRSSSKGRETKS